MPFSAVKTNNENCNDDENNEIKQIDTDNNAAKEIKSDNAKDREKEEQKDKDKDNKEKDKVKADKKATKKLMKELSICKIILEEMEVSFDHFLGVSFQSHLHVCIKYFHRFTKIHGRFYCRLIPNNFQLIRKLLRIPWTCQPSEKTFRILCEFLVIDFL